jgi:hypothetical protein
MIRRVFIFPFLIFLMSFNDSFEINASEKGTFTLMTCCDESSVFNKTSFTCIDLHDVELQFTPTTSICQIVNGAEGSPFNCVNETHVNFEDLPCIQTGPSSKYCVELMECQSVNESIYLILFSMFVWVFFIFLAIFWSQKNVGLPGNFMCRFRVNVRKNKIVVI